MIYPSPEFSVTPFRMSTFDRLERWLKKPGNTPAVLAAQLGYKTSETIRRWVENKRIPEREVVRVEEIILGKGK